MPILIQAGKLTKNPLIDRDLLTPEKRKEKPLKYIVDGPYNLKIEEPTGGEKYYFFILNQLRRMPPYGFGYQEGVGKIWKIKDLLASTETSSYWGSIEQRKGAQQEKVSQYLATIGRMIKDLFQVVRELRITDERLQYYEDSYKGDESAEMALKGVWIDLVEGGAKQPTSVLGMAAQVGFRILPDLFFKIKPIKSEEVDKEVEKIKEYGINRKVREVLARKLKQFLVWKENTYRELKTNKSFKLKYLRQHFNVIKMYMGWVRPYLRNIRKLQQRYPKEGEYESPELVTAFETAEVEVELLAQRLVTEIPTETVAHKEYRFKKYFPCLFVRFRFITIPQMSYQQEFQRGAIHVGRTEMTFESYVLTEEQIKDYIKKQEEEDLELLASINSAIESLGEELIKYLEEAGEVMEKEEKQKEIKKETALEPFKNLFSGFEELFGSLIKVPKISFKKSDVPKNERELAESVAKELAFLPYHILKKAYGMITH